MQNILDAWEEKNTAKNASVTAAETDDEFQEGVAAAIKRDAMQDLKIMFRRHSRLIVRDPVLYLGRCGIVLVTNLVFGFVYWNARTNEQDQALNKYFLNIWYVGVATNSK